MGKPYIRKKVSKGKGLRSDEFTCSTCGHQSGSKFGFKKHFRESVDHDQRRLK